MARHPNPNRPRYSQLIGAARREKHWTQERLAAETGIEPAAIKKYEAGQRQPGFDVLYAICTVLDLDIYYVMDVDLRHGDSMNYHEYVDKPFNKILSMLDDTVSVTSLSDSGYTDDHISILYNDKERVTTKTELIRQATDIRMRLKNEYKVRLAEEINKLVKKTTEK